MPEASGHFRSRIVDIDGFHGSRELERQFAVPVDQKRLIPSRQRIAGEGRALSLTVTPDDPRILAQVQLVVRSDHQRVHFAPALQPVQR